MPLLHLFVAAIFLASGAMDCTDHTVKAVGALSPIHFTNCNVNTEKGGKEKHAHCPSRMAGSMDAQSWLFWHCCAHGGNQASDQPVRASGFPCRAAIRLAHASAR